MTVDPRQAQADLREIQDRQQQVLSASVRLPRRYLAGQGLLVAGFILAVGMWDQLWVVLPLGVVFLVLQAVLMTRWGRRQPAQAHRSQFAGGRLWLTIAASTVFGAAVGGGAAQLVDELGAVGAVAAVLLVALFMVAIGFANPRLLVWSRRRPTGHAPVTGATYHGGEEGSDGSTG